MIIVYNVNRKNNFLSNLLVFNNSCIIINITIMKFPRKYINNQNVRYITRQIIQGNIGRVSYVARINSSLRLSI